MGCLNKTADPFDITDKRNQLKLYVDPVAPFSFSQYKFLVLYAEFGDSLQRVDGNCERLERRRRSFAERIIRPDQICPDLRFFHVDGNNLSAFDGARCGHGIIGVKGKRPVAAAQVRRAHPRQSFPSGFHGRKVRGHAKDGVGNTVVVQGFPERFSLAKLFGGSTANRNHPVAQMNSVLRRFHS